jgi:DNA mismatch repair protein PMS2
MCALSEMTIITRHGKAPHGTKICYDKLGVIKAKFPCSRSVGTTITLENLFYTIPVRRKEFKNKAMQEFRKMVQIIQAYCLVNEKVRIKCTNQDGNKARTTVVNSLGGSTVKDNITNVFTANQAAALIPLKPAILKSGIQSDTSMIANETADGELVLTQEDVDNLNLSRFQLDGWISSCEHGKGRSTKDRQYYYVNSRPCDPDKISKMVNETYRKYNPSQYPFVFLNVKLNKQEIDVNVTPDKRQIFISNEKIMLLALKKALLNTFGTIPSTFKHQNLDISKSFRQPMANSTKLEKSLDESNLDCSTLTQPNPNKFAAMFSQWKATGKTDGKKIKL